MSYPFSVDSPLDWLNKTKNFLLTVTTDSELVSDSNFHKYLASKLESFFFQMPTQFLKLFILLLTEGSEAGKTILIEILIYATKIWSNLAQDANLQIILTELALTSEKLYIKGAIYLSTQLEEIHKSYELSSTLKLKYQDEVLESILEDKDTNKIAEKKEIELEETTSEKIPEIKRSIEESYIPPPAAMAAGSPPAPKKAKPSPQAFSSSSSITSEKEKKTTNYEKESAVELSLDDIVKSKDRVMNKTDLRQKRKTIYSHVHYYSRMNPKKTYSFTVTLSSIMKKLKEEKDHFFSGEKESETRGEFELIDSIRQITVELLLSGCLVQPTTQFIDPNPNNLPKELTFYVTPLVEPGFRATKIQGILFIKDDEGKILHELSLPKLTVVNNRISQLAALIGTLGGGAMPTLDYLFGVNLQSSIASQLAYLLPNLAQYIDMSIFIYILEASIFVGAITLALIWYWKKSRAKMAPKQSIQLQLPSWGV